ncbi:hypothetical protein GCM10028857_20390 [Salinarchaeum chitinilyticum]
MDSSTFEAIHRYGAALSVVASAVAVLAYALGGPDNVVGLFFGWAGPLGVFYFGGGYLTYSSSYLVVGEELLRGVAWYFGSLIAWSVIVTTTTVSATAFTVFGLPALTALGLTLVMVAVRYETGSELKVETDGGQLLVAISGGIVFGFLALYLVLADQAGWWLFGAYLASIPAGIVLWRVLRRRYPAAFSTN